MDIAFFVFERDAVEEIGAKSGRLELEGVLVHRQSGENVVGDFGSRRRSQRHNRNAAETFAKLS